MARVGAGQRVTEKHPGPAVVVVDQHERDEPLHHLDSPATSGGLVGWARQRPWSTISNRWRGVRSRRSTRRCRRRWATCRRARRCCSPPRSRRGPGRLRHRRSGRTGSASGAPRRAAAPADRDAPASCGARIRTVHPCCGGCRLAHVVSWRVRCPRRARTAPPGSRATCSLPLPAHSRSLPLPSRPRPQDIAQRGRHRASGRRTVSPLDHARLSDRQGFTRPRQGRQSA